MPPAQILPSCTVQVNPVIQEAHGSGCISKAANERAAWTNHLAGLRKKPNEGQQVSF